jgi:hypothetical protein
MKGFGTTGVCTKAKTAIEAIAKARITTASEVLDTDNMLNSSPHGAF